MHNAHTALRFLRKFGYSQQPLVVQYAHRACGSGRLSHIWLCRRFHHAAFSGSCEAEGEPITHLPKMNPSTIVVDTLSQGKSIEDTRQLPVGRLNRLENIAEQHSRCLTSLASQFEEQKQLFATILQDPSHAQDTLHSLDVSCEHISECSCIDIEKSALDRQKSSTLSTNRIDSKVCVSGEETKEKIVLASKRSMEVHVPDNDRQTETTDGLQEQGLANVSGRLLAAQEEEGLQKCTLSEEDEKNLDGAWLIDVSDADEHSDIFDDIFDFDDTRSSKAEQNSVMKCSLSDLVRQNKKAFLSSKRERGAATGVDDYERKGSRPLTGKGYKSDDLEVSTRCTSLRTERDDSVMEVEDKVMPSHWVGGGRTGSGSSWGMEHNKSYRYKAGIGGKGSSGRTFGDDRRRRKGREHNSREGYSDAECEEGGRYSSGKQMYKESRARSGYSDESCSKTVQDKGFERHRRNEGRSRY